MFFKKTGNLTEAMQLNRAQVPIADYIPYALHLTENIVKLRNTGDVLATWRMHGIPFETATPEEILMEKQALVNFIHSLRGSTINEPCAIWVHRIRRRYSDRLDAEYESTFAQQFARKYYDKLSSKAMYKNEIYFSLIMRPAQTSSGLFKKATAKTAQGIIDFDNELKERFKVLTDIVEHKMSKYAFADDDEKVFEFQCERLGLKEKKSSQDSRKRYTSEQLSFYRYLATNIFEPLEIEGSPIYNYLCDARIFSGDTSGIVQLEHPKKRTFCGFMDLLDYPSFTETGMNNCLFYGDFEFIETQSFSFKSKREGIDSLDLQRKRMTSGGEASQEQIEDIEYAIEDVKNGRIYMGEYHYSLNILGGSIEQVKKDMSFARSLMEEEAGYKMAVVDVIPECAFMAQLPGNWKWRPRVGMVSSRNFASLAPMHNYDLGKRTRNPWGNALAIFETPAKQPFYFNLHQIVRSRNRVNKRDPGNTFICGKTGTGKSVLLGLIVSFLTSVFGLRILFFDKDRGAELLIRALNGIYRKLERGKPTGFNPFQWEPTERNIIFVQSLVYQCALRPHEQALPVELENKLMDAVRKVFGQPDKSTRRISAVLQYLGSNTELGERLSKWCRFSGKIGSNAWVLDNAHDTTDFSKGKIFAFDYTEFLEDKEVGPIILSYILFAAESLIDGNPFVYVMEEFAKMVSAKTQTIVEFARDKQTTIRKLNGLGIFVTQSPSQVVTEPIGKTLSEQCVTQIFLPNPGADRADYVDGFKLDPTAFEALRSLSEDSRQFLVKQSGRTSICKLDLYGFDDELEILSANPETVDLCEQIRKELNTDDPDQWIPVFNQRVRLLKNSSRRI